MINVTEHFATDIQEFKASTTERVDKIEHLLLENVMEYEIVKKKRKKKEMKQPTELLQNESKT